MNVVQTRIIRVCTKIVCAYNCNLRAHKLNTLRYSYLRGHARLAELKALRKSIGMSGLMVLRPVINEKTVDEWVMEELL